LNVVAPGAVTNAEFARTLGRVLRRPAVLPAPAWALRIALGLAMANEAILGSQRVAPHRLGAIRYSFRHATLEGALQQALQDAKV
jgi:NAD dependent epimerase/dehydratase family enzyme